MAKRSVESLLSYLSKGATITKIHPMPIFVFIKLMTTLITHMSYDPFSFLHFTPMHEQRMLKEGFINVGPVSIQRRFQYKGFLGIDIPNIKIQYNWNSCAGKTASLRRTCPLCARNDLYHWTMWIALFLSAIPEGFPKCAVWQREYIRVALDVISVFHLHSIDQIV